MELGLDSETVISTCFSSAKNRKIRRKTIHKFRFLYLPKSVEELYNHEDIGEGVRIHSTVLKS